MSCRNDYWLKTGWTARFTGQVSKKSRVSAAGLAGSVAHDGRAGQADGSVLSS